MKSYIFSITAASILFCSCKHQPTKKEQVFKVFNQGVSLNINAIEAQNIGNWEKAADLNRQSIVRFQEAFEIDSTYPPIRSALAHSLYIDKQFKSAISFFESDIKTNGETAMSYREMGLCKINIGEVKDGKLAIDKAFSLDTSQEIRAITNQDLEDISDQAFSYGESYEKEGQIEKGKDYKQFAVTVLTMALEYNKLDSRIEKKLLELAQQSGNKEALEYYKKVIHP